MEVLQYSLWDKVPGTANYEPYLMHFIPDNKKTDSAILIVPGSGYKVCPARPKQEGERVAEHLCKMGINVFVLVYRVAPDYFPLPILDGRRAVRYIRYNSEKFGINKNKIAAMGYSSGGHLTASLFSYKKAIEFENIDEIDKEDFVPDYQILCYPVIGLDKENEYIHQGSPVNLLADKYEEYKDELSFEFSTVPITAPTFIWHNFDDDGVSVVNSLKYAECLKAKGTSVEMHIFPDGGHGIGMPIDDTKVLNHDKIWIDLVCRWLEYRDFCGEGILKY